MSEPEIDELKKVLREALPPVGESELGRDLWPVMFERLAERPLHLPWWDWVLLASVSAAILLFPAAVPALLYHL